MLVIIKIGSNLLSTEDDLDIDFSFIASLAEQIKKLKKKGYKFIIVSSGAVLAGIKKLGKRPKELVEKQAIASIGQAFLMHIYDNIFSNYNLRVSQVLLNADVFKNIVRYKNAKNTFEKLLEWGIIPIVNENDVIAVEELIFGDNDFLTAYLSIMLNPSFVIIMSTAGGIYTGNPKDKNSKLIRELNNPLEAIKFVSSSTSEYGSGGMKSKLMASNIIHSLGIPIAIVSKKVPLEDILIKKDFEGTLIKPSPKPLRDKKRIIAFIEQPKGVIYIDKGAEEALYKGKSLLAVGIKKFEGNFSRNDLVAVKNLEGELIAKGKINFSSEELKKIIGKNTEEIRKIFPNRPPEVIHRDKLTQLPPSAL